MKTTKKFLKDSYFVIVGFTYVEDNIKHIDWDTITGNIDGYETYKEAKQFVLDLNSLRSFNIVGITEKTNTNDFYVDLVNNGDIKVLLTKDLKTQEVITEFCCCLNLVL